MPERARLLILFISFHVLTFGQPVKDTVSFRIVSRYSFYSYEKEGEALLHIPGNMVFNNLSVILKINDSVAATWKGVPGKKILRIPFRIDKAPSISRLAAEIIIPGINKIYITGTDLIVLEYKPNEVKTDRFTGGLIVNRRNFFPFGFYCYSPVYPSLPEEEAVRGFNMISPYQAILPEKLNERKAYMDRCARLGMKVHYNLLSVAGGGGAGSKISKGSKEKLTLLVNEIKTFRDHPALLAWYISDEPTGNNITPDSLLRIYRIVKQADPWHPVSVVFMAPFMSSKKYAEALDIVMADPYPIPRSPSSMTGDVTGSLSAEFTGKKPVWIVPQAFGGAEWWEREPTIQEVRAMTYQPIIRGSRGIQYFIRQGLNLFPKSTATWGECGRMAMEIAELTPWLLSDEENIPVKSGNPNIIVTSAMKNGSLMVMAANRSNTPQAADFYLARSWSGKAKVIFENRSVNVINGSFSDIFQALGTQVYIMEIRPRKDIVAEWKDNLTLDPGFEDISSPGVPASCYARGGGDRGATYFLDSREHLEGSHSLRLVAPGENSGVRLRFFPIRTTNGRSYYISVYAKADPEQRSDSGSYRKQYFEISLGEYGKTRFMLTADWKEFVTNVTIPPDSDQPGRSNIILQMLSEGVAWFDMLQVSEGLDIKRCINPILTQNW